MVVLKSSIENTKGRIRLREIVTNLRYKKHKHPWGQQVAGNLTLLTRKSRTATMALKVTRIDCHSMSNTRMRLPKGSEYDLKKRRKTHLGGHLYKCAGEGKTSEGDW